MGIQFALLLYRCDSDTLLTDITKDATAQEMLRKHNSKEMWQKFRASESREADKEAATVSLSEMRANQQISTSPKESR